MLLQSVSAIHAQTVASIASRVKRCLNPRPLSSKVRCFIYGVIFASYRFISIGSLGAKMSKQRVYKSSDYMQVSGEEPMRSVVAETEHSVIVAWHVEPGQKIAPHTHPDGQDTWTILSGQGQYQVDDMGNTVAVVPGDVVVAKKGQVHGVLCTSGEPLRFISVVAPLEAGYVPLPPNA